MTHARRFRLYLAGTALLALGAASAAGAQQRRTRPANNRGSRSQVDTTFAFDKSGTLTVNAGTGDVIVTGSTANQMHIVATSDDDDNVRVDVTRRGAEVAVTRRGSDSRFEISVPQGTHVTVRSNSGDVTVRGTRGEVEVNSTSGDVHVQDVSGPFMVTSFSGEVEASNVNGRVEIHTQSGDLTLSDIRGDIEIGNTSGDIKLQRVASKLVRARTTSGDVSYDGTIDPSGRYEFKSYSGDIRLNVPRDASAQLAVSTWTGEIESAFPITLKPGEHGIGSATSKKFTFEIGGGQAHITAETISGDLTVSSSGRGPRE